MLSVETESGNRQSKINPTAPSRFEANGFSITIKQNRAQTATSL